MSAYDDFAADSMARPVWLWEMFPRDSTGAEVTLRFGTESWLTGATDTPAFSAYDGRVSQGLNFGVRAFMPRTAGRGQLDPGGEVRLLQRAGDLDAYGDPAAYVWDGARVRCLHGGFSPRMGRRLLVSEFAELWAGKAETFDPGLYDAIVKLRPLDAALSSPLEKRRHRGNTWCLDFSPTTFISFGAAGVPSTLNLTGAMAMDFVIYCDSAGMGSIRRLIGWDHSATTYPYQARINASNQLVYRDSASTVLVTSTFNFAASRRYWVAISIGSGTLRFFFLDLATMVATTETHTVSASARPTADGLFRIGHATAGHDGLLEQIRIWSAAKTPEQMRQIRLRPMTTDELAASDLELALLLDTGSGTSAVDSSPNGSTGTINGTAPWYSSLEGGPDLAGREKINSFGEPAHMEPRFVGLSGSSLQKTYQLHADLITDGKLIVMEGGVAGPTLDQSETDLKTFLSTATAATKYDVLRNAAGSFLRLGSNLTLPLGATLAADAADGTYRTQAGALVKYLVTTRGDAPMAGGEIDTAAFTALDAAASGANGYVVSESKSVGEAIGALLAGVGAYAWTNRAGLFTVAQLSEPAATPDFILDERDIFDLRPLPLGVPISRATVLHRRNFAPIDSDRVSVSATAAERIFAESTWTRASYRDATIADLHPRSEELKIESYLIAMDDAMAEASRHLGLHGVERRMWECISRIRFPTLEPFMTMELRLSLRSLQGTALARLNFPARFKILGWLISGADNRMSTFLWGPHLP